MIFPEGNSLKIIHIPVSESHFFLFDFLMFLVNPYQGRSIKALIHFSLPWCTTFPPYTKRKIVQQTIPK